MFVKLKGYKSVPENLGTISQPVLGFQHMHRICNRLKAVTISMSKRVGPAPILELHRKYGSHFNHRSSRHLVPATLINIVFPGTPECQIGTYCQPVTWICIIGNLQTRPVHIGVEHDPFPVSILHACTKPRHLSTVVTSPSCLSGM